MENKSLAVKKIVKVWDENGIIDKNIDFLLNKTKKINFPLTSNSKQIIQDLHNAYREIPCAGIAANQIGYNKKIFIGLKHDNYSEDKENSTIGNPNADNYEFYINPRIHYSSKKSLQEGEEGCLSIPEVRLIAERFDEIKVTYFNGHGKKIKKPLSGFMSRLFQHELDHLDGKLMVENNQIKQVYQISENKNIKLLYPNLLKQIKLIK